MACFHPVPAFQDEDGRVVFTERTGHGSVRSLSLPCGQCVGCRLERSRQWAVRCMHEAKLYDRNCFITLTYSEENLPADLSLRYQDFQLFMKRLRRRFSTSKIRFYMCGEYGEDHADHCGRPHYHACLFNCYFPDQLYFKRVGKSVLYTSAILTELWPHGFTLIGAVTFESAAYVARYCMKKVTGKPAEEHYRVVDPDTGEVRTRVPEFARMSLRPGIGGGWLLRFLGDVFPAGECVVNGRFTKAPRYYDKLYERSDTDDGMARLQAARLLRASRKFADNCDDRLAVKEQVTYARVSQFNRNL